MQLFTVVYNKEELNIFKFWDISKHSELKFIVSTDVRRIFPWRGEGAGGRSTLLMSVIIAALRNISRYWWIGISEAKSFINYFTHDAQRLPVPFN